VHGLQPHLALANTLLGAVSGDVATPATSCSSRSTSIRPLHQPRAPGNSANKQSCTRPYRAVSIYTSHFLPRLTSGRRGMHTADAPKGTMR
jgi:hypothetical protein